MDLNRMRGWNVAALLLLFASFFYSCEGQQCDPGDAQTLLEFIAAFQDPGEFFFSWKEGTNCCIWQGVNCTSSGRVQGLEVEGPFPLRTPTPVARDPAYQGVVGASLTNLSELRILRLESILFNEPMPDVFGSLKKLESLSLYLNNFTGTLSRTIGGATSLRNLKVDTDGPFSGFVTPGPFPDSFCNLVNLETVTLKFLITGSIPLCFCRFTRLTQLILDNNNLVGEIPSCFGGLLGLEYLALGQNQLTGTIPLALSRVVKLQYLSLSSNRLSGTIPALIGNLINLSDLVLSSNALSGSIPSSVVRLKKLEYLDLSNNSLSGSIPAKIGDLPELRVLYLWGNFLSGTIPSGIGKLTKLALLDLSINSLSGSIPPELGKLSNLTVLLLYSNRFTGNLSPVLADVGIGADGFNLDISDNRLSGSIPPDLCSRGRSRYIDAGQNFFSGGFPLALAACTKANFSYNLLSDSRQIGTLPANVAMDSLLLRNNRFSGPAPGWISDLLIASSETIRVVDVSSNSFTGPLPTALFTTPSLQIVNASRNSFSSELPAKVEAQFNQYLDLSYNKLSGLIRFSLFDSLKEAVWLDFSFNQLTGPLPGNSGNFTSISYFDLSDNQLNGTVPANVDNLPALYLDFSNNQFTGDVPSKRPPPGATLPSV